MIRPARLVVAVALSACAAPPASVAAPSSASTPATTPPSSAAPPAAHDAAPVAPDPAPTGARDDEIARLARHAVRAFANDEARFAADGKRVVYRSDRGDGAWRAWLADPRRPEAPPVAIADLADPVRVVVPVGDAAVIVAARAGADALLRVPLPKKPKPGAPAKLDPPTPVAIGTPALARRDAPVAIEGEKPRIVITERAPGEAASRVVEVPMRPGKEPRVVATDPQGGALVDADRDGRRGVLLRAGGSLATVDLASGAIAELPLPAGMIARAAAMAGDGATVVVGGVAADAGVIAVIDATTGAVRARAGEPGAVVRGVAIGPKGDRIAALLDRGDREEVRLLDAPSLARGADVALPPGAGRLGRFARDGRRVAVTWSTPASPADVLAVDAKTGAVSRLRDDVRAPLAVFPAIETTTARAPRGQGAPIGVVVHRPAGDARGPAVVLAPGGPIARAGHGYAPFVRLMTGLGWAVVEVASRADDAELAAVAAWVAAQPFADPARVKIVGAGEGGLAEGAADPRDADVARLARLAASIDR